MEDAHGARGTPSWPLRLVRWPLKLLRTLARVIPQAVDGYFADRCGQHAAGIAYRVLFSLVPLSIVLVAIFGLVLRNDDLRNDVIKEIIDALPLSETRQRRRHPRDREAGAHRRRLSASSACSSSAGPRPG